MNRSRYIALIVVLSLVGAFSLFVSLMVFLDLVFTKVTLFKIMSLVGWALIAWTSWRFAVKLNKAIKVSHPVGETPQISKTPGEVVE